jgi:hypothetical protein
MISSIQTVFEPFKKEPENSVRHIATTVFSPGLQKESVRRLGKKCLQNYDRDTLWKASTWNATNEMEG